MWVSGFHLRAVDHARHKSKSPRFPGGLWLNIEKLLTRKSGRSRDYFFFFAAFLVAAFLTAFLAAFFVAFFIGLILPNI